jgi:hypothetical protein
MIWWEVIVEQQERGREAGRKKSRSRKESRCCRARSRLWAERVTALLSNLHKIRESLEKLHKR